MVKQTAYKIAPYAHVCSERNMNGEISYSYDTGMVEVLFFRSGAFT